MSKKNWMRIETAPAEVAVLVWHKKEGVITATYKEADKDMPDMFPAGWAAGPSLYGQFSTADERPWLLGDEDSLTHWHELPDPPEDVERQKAPPPPPPPPAPKQCCCCKRQRCWYEQ